jgi:hypothetical protein
MAPFIVDQVPIARSRRASSLLSPAEAAKDAIWPPNRSLQRDYQPDNFGRRVE